MITFASSPVMSLPRHKQVLLTQSPLLKKYIEIDATVITPIWLEVMMLLKVRNIRKDSSLAHAQHLTLMFENQPITFNASFVLDHQQSWIKVSA